VPEPLNIPDHEFVPPTEPDAVNDGREKRKRNMILLKTAAALLSVVIVKDAFNFDILHSDPLGNPDRHYHDVEFEEITDTVDTVSAPVEVPELQPEALDKADTSFPLLDNLEPNGNVPGYGVLDEEFVRLENADGSVDYLYCTDGVWNRGGYVIDAEGLHLDDGTVATDYIYRPEVTDISQIEDDYINSPGNWTLDELGFVWFIPPGFNEGNYSSTAMPLRENAPIGPVNGASYDEFTNTLTLNNFTGHFLNINLMGNGFKVKLVGENRLTGLVGWGFMYGGSITLTGTGSLSINNPEGPGIRLECENSRSCLMIDKDVKLNVYGANGAILVRDTLMDKGIYYLEPLKMDSFDAPDAITRDFVTFDGMTSGNIYSVRDTEGRIVKELSFAKEED
jgi:hypothetical protein